MSLSDSQIEDYISKIKTLFKNVDNFVMSFDKFHKDWNFEYSDGVELGYKTIVKDAKDKEDIIQTKLLRKNLHCLIFGGINNGKSAIINALLGKEVMISQNGETTNSFVEIKKSENKEDYIIFPDNPLKKENISLISRVDEADINHVEGSSHVNMYLSGQSCPLLEDNIVLIDSPGIGSKIEMDKVEIDKKVQEECKKADVLIFVISCSSGFREKENEFLKNYQRTFKSFKIIFLFNFSDEVWKRIEYFKEKYTKEANEHLCKIFEVKKEYNDEEIFFISAKERLKILQEKTISKVGWQQRNTNFEDFIKCLKAYQTESITKRHSELKEFTNEIIKKMYEEIKTYKIKENDNVVENVKIIIEYKKNIEEIINKEVSSIFTEMYEMSFVKGRKIVNKNINEKDKIIDKLSVFMKELWLVMTESLKIRIKDELQRKYNEKECNIINKLSTNYLPFFFNFIADINEMKSLCSNYKEIIRIITKFKTITMVGAGVGSAAALAGGGAVLGVFLAIDTLIAAPVLAAVGLGTGGGFGSVSSYISTKITNTKRSIYKPRYEEHEQVIISFWKKKEELMNNSFQSFLKTKEIPKLPSSFDDDFNIFEKSVNNLIQSEETSNINYSIK